MEKKHITVIGTCCSRYILNNPKLQSIFDVDLYVFKNNPWSICDENGLDISSSIIRKMPAEEFIVRNIEYDINKSAKTAIAVKNSEYVIVDLYSFKDALYLVKFNDKSTYVTTNNFNRYHKILMNTLKEYKIPISCERKFFEDIDPSIIKKGLVAFAQFLNNHFKHIIINKPKASKRYYTFKHTIENYTDEQLREYNYWIDITTKYSDFLIENLDNPIILEWKDDFISRSLVSSDIPGPPEIAHLTDEAYYYLANKLLDLLNLNYKDYWTNILTPESLSQEIAQNRYIYLQNKFEQITKDIFCNLRAYTNWLKTLSHHLFIFVAHADMQNHIKFWNNRATLGLNFNPEFRDSYIGIINTRDNYFYEQSQKEALKFDYKIPNTDECISIESHGFYAKNYSSILYHDKEYSKQKRGVNIFVLDLETMQVVDYANCDSCLDNNLEVDSNMLSVFKSN